MNFSEKNPRILKADARRLAGLVEPASVDLVFTSPPYWQCRDYGHANQIGWEKTPGEYVAALIQALESWRPLLRPSASVIINIGDVYRKGGLLGIPGMFEVAARNQGWLIANRIIWAKTRGMPQPRPNRLASRHEFLYHLAPQRHFYFDQYALNQHLGQDANAGDIWTIEQSRSASGHLAPFPSELVRRAILISCPERVCQKCGKPYTRRLRPSMQLDISRPQARRAMAIYRSSGLTAEHIAAIRAVGISDAGKGRKVQTGALKNSAGTLRLADEAKAVLGGYFREFTFAPKRQVGWNKCRCRVEATPGLVLDPFMGSGTTLRVAVELGRLAVGVDLVHNKSW